MSMTTEQINCLTSLPGWDEWCARVDAEEKARNSAHRVPHHYSVSAIAHKAGLSESTIRRDRRKGHLVPTGKKGKVTVSDITPWLIDRSQRCNGLTVESKTWLDELENSR